MTTTLPAYNRKDWQKGYQSQTEEHQYWIEEIEGTIPPELNGTLFRNGPGLLDIHGQQIQHPFDGDGMISAVSFQDGKAHFRNRFVRTEGYLAEQKAGKILYRGFATQKPGGWLANIFDLQPKNVANTNVIYWADKLLALWEAGEPHRLDPLTLETIGIENLEGNLQPGQAFSAHPRIEKRQDGQGDVLVNFGVKPGLSSIFTIFEIDSSGNLLKRHAHTIPGFAFLHDMAITPNYCIFFQNPLVFNPLPFALGWRSASHCLNFSPSLPMRVIIIPRNGKDKIQILDTEPFFVFHHANAWEEEDEIYVDSICYQSFPTVEPDTDFRQMDFDTIPAGQLWRLKINLKQAMVKHQVLESRSCEFPIVHPHHVGRPYRYLYVNATHAPIGNAPLQAVMKIDQKTGERQIWSAAPRGFAGDIVFVPRPNSVEEDEGWLLMLMYDAAYHRSDVVILDARDLTQGPIARLHLKHHIPHGFHASWTSQVF